MIVTSGHPALVNRENHGDDDPGKELVDDITFDVGQAEVAYTNQTHREFLYRQAFEMGRRLTGFEVQKVLAAVDLLEQTKLTALPIGVAGTGECCLVALYTVVLGSRIDARVR